MCIRDSRDRMGIYDQAFIVNAVMGVIALVLMLLVKEAGKDPRGKS